MNPNLKHIHLKRLDHNRQCKAEKPNFQLIPVFVFKKKTLETFFLSLSYILSCWTFWKFFKTLFITSMTFAQTNTITISIVNMSLIRFFGVLRDCCQTIGQAWQHCQWTLIRHWCCAVTVVRLFQRLQRLGGVLRPQAVALLVVARAFGSQTVAGKLVGGTHLWRWNVCKCQMPSRTAADRFSAIQTQSQFSCLAIGQWAVAKQSFNEFHLAKRFLTNRTHGIRNRQAAQLLIKTIAMMLKKI